MVHLLSPIPKTLKNLIDDEVMDVSDDEQCDGNDKHPPISWRSSIDFMDIHAKDTGSNSHWKVHMLDTATLF